MAVKQLETQDGTCPIGRARGQKPGEKQASTLIRKTITMALLQWVWWNGIGGGRSGYAPPQFELHFQGAQKRYNTKKIFVVEWVKKNSMANKNSIYWISLLEIRMEIFISFASFQMYVRMHVCLYDCVFVQFSYVQIDTRIALVLLGGHKWN